MLEVSTRWRGANPARKTTGHRAATLRQRAPASARTWPAGARAGSGGATRGGRQGAEDRSRPAIALLAVPRNTYSGVLGRRLLAHAPCGRWTRRMWPTCAVGRRSALRREAGMRRDAGDPGDVVWNAASQTQQDTSHGTPLVGTPQRTGGPRCRPQGVRRGPGRRGRLRAADLNRTAEPGGGGGDNSGLIHSRPWRALNVLCEAGRGEQGVRAEPKLLL